MIQLSKEKLDRIVERDNTDRMIEKLVNGLAKAFIPLLIAEVVIAFLLSDKVNFFISILVFGLFDTAMPFLICFSAIFIEAAVKIVRTSGGILPAIRFFVTARRTKEYYNLVMDEICSDNTLAEALRLEHESERNKYPSISALSHVMWCYGMRCEFDKAESAFEELVKLPQKEFISRNDYMAAALDYAIFTDNNKLFLDTVTAYSDVLVKLERRDANSVCALLSIEANEHKLHGNFNTALKYLDWCQEYRVKMRQQGKYTNQRPLRNYRKYSDAALYLEKAEIYLLMNDIENARLELDASDEAISTVTCEIPPVFVRKRERLVSLITRG